MNNQRLGVLATPVIFLLLVLASTTATSTVGGDYWVFVTAYVGIAVFSVARRMWIGTVVAVSVAGVRAMIALKITGWPFEVLSSFFVAGLFLLIYAASWSRAWRK
jgi:hypothetical protein